MIPASLNMPIMSGGEVVAPPEPISFNANTNIFTNLVLSNLDLTVTGRIATNSNAYVGGNIRATSQKAYGKWQFSFYVDVGTSGSSGNQAEIIFGITKKHRSSYGRLGQATYDYCLVYRHGTSENVYKRNDATQTLLTSGASTCPDVGDYITILVDFDAGKIWFAINGTCYEGDPNAGTSPSFTFTPNHAFCPSVCLMRDVGTPTTGTYTLQTTLPYGTWSSYQLWNTDEDVGLDDDIGYDSYFSSNSLLWVADGIANGTTSLTDLSPLANTITNNLSTVDAIDDVLNALLPVCGDGCLDFDGNDSFTISNLTPFQFGTGDFTIEMYVKRNGVPSTQEYLYESRNSATETLIPYILIHTSGVVRLRYSGADRLASITNICDNLWHHIAVSRDGNNIRLFIDGVQQAILTGVSALSFTANALRIGASYVPSLYLNGSLNFIRVTKGVARYTSSFTPPRFWLSS